MSVDQVGADLGTSPPVSKRPTVSWCQSIRLVPTSAPYSLLLRCTPAGCQSIRLVPTSAPAGILSHSWHSVSGQLCEHALALVDLTLWLVLSSGSDSFMSMNSKGFEHPLAPPYHLRARGGG